MTAQHPTGGPTAGDVARRAEGPRGTVRDIVVVLGMHRSGTSLLTRALHRLGVSLGKRLLTAAEPDNAEGYWEQRDIVEAQEALLEAALDRDWHGPKGALPYGERWWERPEMASYRDRLTWILEAELSQSPGLWGFKDPRTARLLPLWRPVFARLGARPRYVLGFRHPAAVAASLARRNGMSPARAQLLWLTHHLDAIAEAGDDIVAVVDYDDWFADPAGVARRLAAALGLSGEIDAAAWQGFVDPAQRHHGGEAAGGLLPEAERAFALLRQATEAGTVDVAAWRELGERVAAAAQLFAAWGETVATAPPAPSPAPPAAPRRDAELRSAREALAVARAQAANETAERERLAEQLALVRDDALRNARLAHAAQLDAARARDAAASLAAYPHAVRILAGGDPHEVVRQIWQSTSWRLARPLRWLSARLRGRPEPVFAPPDDLIGAAMQVVQLRSTLSWRATGAARAVTRLLRRERPRDLPPPPPPPAPLSAEPGSVAVSLLMPLVRPVDVAGLRATLASLAAQELADWQLVVALPADDAEEAVDACREATETDRRVLLARHGGEWGAALEAARVLATGEALGVVAPGDRLAPAALARAAEILGRPAAPDIVAIGSRREPAGEASAAPGGPEVEPADGFLVIVSRELAEGADALAGDSPAALIDRLVGLARHARAAHIAERLVTSAGVRPADTAPARPALVIDSDQPEDPWLRHRYSHAYRAWLADTQLPLEADWQGIERRLAALPGRPLISLVVPIVRPIDGALMRDALARLQRQAYPDWEVVLAAFEDGATVAGLAPSTLVPSGPDGPDPRFRVATVAGALASDGEAILLGYAIVQTGGSALALLEAGDILADTALLHVAEILVGAPDIAVVTVDSDLIDHRGVPCEPVFRGRPDEERALRGDLFGAFTAIQRERLAEAGRIARGSLRSAWHALVLEAVRGIGEADAPRRCRHVPYVLHHRRAMAGDVAHSVDQAALLREDLRAVVAARLGDAPVVVERPPDEVGPALRCRIRRRLSSRPQVLAILSGTAAPGVPQVALALAGDEAIAAQFCFIGTPPPADAAAEAAWRSLLPIATFVPAAPSGRPGAVLNAALRAGWAMQGGWPDLVLLIDRAVVPEAGAVATLAAEALRPEVGLVGGRALDRAGRLVDGGLVLDAEALVARPHRGMSLDGVAPLPRGLADDPFLVRQVTAVSLSCAMFRPEVFERVGGFAEDLWRDDLLAADFGLRVADAGWRVLWTAEATFRYATPDEAVFAERWTPRIAAGDPWWSPNAETRLRLAGRRPPRVGPPA